MRKILWTERYPTQTWMLFWGSLVSMTGQSLVWPFLTIYIRQQLGLPLAQITLLFTVQSIASLAATGVLGPAVDRFGRKWAMVAAPLVNGLALVAMSRADSLALWGVLLAFYAMSGVVFRLGSHAMIADLIEPERRVGAYALLRMAFNVGIAIGPAIGGYLVITSYALSFLIAAATQFGLAVFVLVAIHETLPEALPGDPAGKRQIGYGPVLRDRPFLSFWGVYLLIEVAASLVFTLLAVYVKEQYAIPEDRYGFILGTNAAMVVLFQYAVTRVTRRYPPMPVMAVSGLFYALGMAIYAAGFNFFTFWLGMVTMTVGELIISPTATALVADLAPPDMRGRYMGAYSLSYRIGGGVGPVVGGFLSDTLAPNAPWVFGMIACLLAMGGFLLMSRSRAFQSAEVTKAARHV